jgi:hypothetical protein
MHIFCRPSPVLSIQHCLLVGIGGDGIPGDDGDDIRLGDVRDQQTNSNIWGGLCSLIRERL